MFPKVYLAIDNCVASKRWSVPADWMNLFADCGVFLVEASADNEIDPLYTEPSYLRDWAEEVQDDAAHTGVRVVNLYSGHGTYATLGLAHPDIRIRERIQHQWLEKMIDLAADMEAGLGFFCHAFDQRTLNDPKRHATAYQDLVKRLADLAAYAENKGVKTIGVEQMYSPHQIPWTVIGANSLLKDIFDVGKKNFYLTIDTGHQTGQRRFSMPDDGSLKAAFEQIRKTGRADGVYLGSAAAEKAVVEGALKGNSDRMLLEMMRHDRETYPWLYAPQEDSDVYRWISTLGAYSPIIHLQQTDGMHSAHEPFRIGDDGNPSKKINGKQLLESLMTAYGRNVDPNMPAPCQEIVLTLELFAGTAELTSDIRNKIKDSVKYWRQFIPRDGQTLDVLVDKLNGENLKIY